jgi:hypothetical protein
MKPSHLFRHQHDQFTQDIRYKPRQSVKGWVPLTAEASPSSRMPQKKARIPLPIDIRIFNRTGRKKEKKGLSHF